MPALHVRGRGLPDGEPVEWWVVDEGLPHEHGRGGLLSAEPISDAQTVFENGWIIPGLVDAHCHVGLGPGGPTEFDEAIAQAERERDVGALLLRDAGSPVDTRSLDDRDDLPRKRDMARIGQTRSGLIEDALIVAAGIAVVAMATRNRA